ncbi:MAG: hypothetical protein Q4B96_05205 [Bacillota bacterium]|nr:hypothetical protein [Bacillota bacterium]
MMRKFLIVLLAVAMIFALAACAQDPAEPAEGEEQAVDENGEPVLLDAEVSGAVEVSEVGDAAEIESTLGVDMGIAEEYVIDRYSIVNSALGQAEFVVDGDKYVVRAAKGEQENLSGVDKRDFSADETEEIAGQQVRLRYYSDDDQIIIGRSIAIADVYVADEDTSYCLAILQNGNKEKLVAFMEQLLQ